MPLPPFVRSPAQAGWLVALLALTACSSSASPSPTPAPGNSIAGGGANAQAGGGTVAGASSGVAGGGSSGSGVTAGTGGASTETGGASTEAGGAPAGGTSAAGSASGGTTTGAGGSGGGNATAGESGAPGSAGGAGGGAGAAAYNPCPTGGSPCRIMPLGDSITWGVGSTDGGGYRDELFKKAAAASAKFTFVGSGQSGPQTLNGQAFPRSNEGHSGWTIDDGKGNDGSSRSGLYPKISGWLAATPPDIILLMIGTNDINVQVDVANAPKRLGLLLDRIVQSSPKALLVVAQIVPTKTDPTNVRVEAYNAAIPALVDERRAAGKHVTLVNMYTAFSANSSYKSALMNDELHPNDAGHAVLAGVWWGVIGSLLPR